MDSSRCADRFDAKYRIKPEKPAAPKATIPPLCVDPVTLKTSRGSTRGDALFAKAQERRKSEETAQRAHAERQREEAERMAREQREAAQRAGGSSH